MKNTRNWKAVFLCFFIPFILSVTLSSAADGNKTLEQISKEIDICERYYEDGDYVSALNTCKKIFNKHEGTGLYTIRIQGYLAKYYQAVGDETKFGEAVNKYLEYKEKHKKGDKESYGLGLIHVANLYAEATNANEAERRLEEGLKLVKNNLSADFVQEKILTIKMKIAFQRGNYPQFDELIEELTKLREQFAQQSEARFYDDAQSKIKTYELSPQQITRFKTAYAETLTLKADVNRRRGDFNTAQKDLEIAENWIKENLSIRGLAFIRNQHIKSLLALDKGEPREDIRQMMEKNIYLAERMIGTVHKTYFEIHEALIDYYTDAKYVQKQASQNEEELKKASALKAAADGIQGTLRDSKYRIRGSRQNYEIKKNARLYYGEDKVQYAIAKRLEAKRRFKLGLKSLIGGYNPEEVLDELYKNRANRTVNSIDFLKLLKLRYEVKLAEDKFEEAKNTLDLWLQHSETTLGKSSLNYLLASIEKAHFLTRFTNEFSTADSLFKTQISALEKLILPSQKHYIESLNKQVNYYTTLSEYQKANQLIDRTLVETEEVFGKKHINYAIQIEKSVNLLMKKGDFKEVDAKVTEMLGIFDNQYNNSLRVEYSRILETAARYYATMGLYEDAEDFLRKSTRLYKKSSNSIAASSGADELAYLYIKTGRYAETEKILKDAIELRIKRYGEGSAFLITPYNQMARLQLEFYGDYIPAESFATQALIIAEKQFGENSLRMMESQEVLAEAYISMGDYEKGKQELEKIIAEKTSILGKSHIDLANLSSKLALVKFYNQEGSKDIESLFTKGIDIIAENLGTNTPIYAEALKNSALIYIDNGNYEKATQNLNLANNILKQQSPLRSAEIEVILAKIDIEQNQLGAAEFRYKSVLKMYKKTFGKKHPRYVEALGLMARMYYVMGDFAKCEKYILTALNSYKEVIKDEFVAFNEREKGKYWLKIKDDFEFFNNFVINQKREKLYGLLYDNTLLTKPLLLQSSTKVRKAILSSRDSVLIAKYDDWKLKRAEYIKYIGLSQEQLKEEGIDIKKLQKEIDNLEKELSRNSEAFSKAQEEIQEQVEWSDIRKTLKSNEYAVEIIRNRYFDKSFEDSVVYSALVLDNQTGIRIINMSEGNKMEKSYLKYYRNTIKFSIDDRNSYLKYWEPIHKLLPEKATVYLATEGVYNQINLSAILVEEGNHLTDKSNIVLLSSTDDLVKTSPINTSKDVVIVGNPTFYESDVEASTQLGGSRGTRAYKRNINQLPGAEREANKIAQIFEKGGKNKVTLLVGDNATEEMFNKNEAFNSPKILHIATHGFFEPDINNGRAGNSNYISPLLRSGLLLRGAGDLMKDNDPYKYNRSEGIITAQEMMDMDLDGSWVILSACETGLGDTKVGEGVYGLQRALFVAGAELVVMSLFKVDDEATFRLMELFYDKVENGKQDKRVAFNEAQKELREEYPDPVYWGAFVMVSKN
jgi:CHAT domain-containing protein